MPGPIFPSVAAVAPNAEGRSYPRPATTSTPVIVIIKYNATNGNVIWSSSYSLDDLNIAVGEIVGNRAGNQGKRKKGIAHQVREDPPQRPFSIVLVFVFYLKLSFSHLPVVGLQYSVFKM